MKDDYNYTETAYSREMEGQTRRRAKPENDEFECDGCEGIFDIDQSHRDRRTGELFCDSCRGEE